MRLPLFLVATLFLSACSLLQQEHTAPDAHTSRTSLDWAGSYYGKLPCADCPGIETQIRLFDFDDSSNQGRYQRLSYYLGQSNDGFFKESGSFRWTSDGRSIELIKEGQVAYTWQVKEGALHMLDRQGKPIESAMKKHYRLTKLTPKQRLSGQMQPRTWLFTEIAGNGISNKMQAFLSFNLEEKRVTGFTGCNRLTGPLEISDNQMRLGRLAMTRRACPQSNIESQVTSVLRQTAFYRFARHNLILLSEQGSTLAKLTLQMTE